MSQFLSRTFLNILTIRIYFPLGKTKKQSTYIAKKKKLFAKKWPNYGKFRARKHT